jgi:transcriptional regulator with XRE-family HTH domain
VVDVDAAEILRMARRQAGLSQRGMASASGVSVATLAAVEAGRRIPSYAVIEAVLAAAGLEIAVDRRVPVACRHVREHLQDSLSVRLHRWLGGSGDPRRERTLPLWCQLRDLTAAGEVALCGRAALGLWLPGVTRPVTLKVSFALHPGATTPPVAGLRLVDGPLPRGPMVSVSIGNYGSLQVPTPAALALDARCAGERTALRTVARLLHEAAPVDDAGRRTAAHRDPAHEREDGEVWHTKRWKQLEMPPAHDRRSWRLDDEASLAAWLRRHGFPA